MNRKGWIGCCCFVAFCLAGRAQEIRMTEFAPLEEVYGEIVESDELLPMQEVGMESGYLLYEAPVTLASVDAELEMEHVRDYAAVYLDGVFQGTLTDACRTLRLSAAPGEHRLQCYVENIGRITYGPEILDNSRGLFGRALVGGEAVSPWTITPLCVRDADPAALTFHPLGERVVPGFRRGSFRAESSAACYLDVSGWGMGEVWVNGEYVGSFWDEEKQQSILLPEGLLRQDANSIVVFDLKNHDPAATMRLSDKPVFK